MSRIRRPITCYAPMQSHIQRSETTQTYNISSFYSSAKHHCIPWHCTTLHPTVREKVYTHLWLSCHSSPCSTSNICKFKCSLFTVWSNNNQYSTMFPNNRTCMLYFWSKWTSRLMIHHHNYYYLCTSLQWVIINGMWQCFVIIIL